MNILILTTRLTGGGAERVAAELSNGLADQHRITVCVFSTEDGVTYEFSGELRDLGVPCSTHPVRRYLTLYGRLPVLRNIKREHNIDVTVSFLNWPNLANLLTHAGGRRVISIRNCLSRRLAGPRNMLTRLLIRSLYHRADQVVSVSDGVGLDAIQQGFVSNRCVRTIYNPVNRERIDRMAGEPLPEAC